MGVKITNRKYTNQFYPNTESTDWLIGNVGDWQRLELDFESTVEFKSTQGESVSINSEENTFTLNNGKKWSDYGFDIGDNVVMTWKIMSDLTNSGTWTTTNETFSFVIQNLYDSIIESDTNFDFGIWDTIPIDRGNLKIKDARFFSNKEPEGIKFKYTHLTNDDFDSGNLRSFIDGTETIFSFAGLQNLPTNGSGNMDPDGFQSGMSIENVKIQKLGGGGSSFSERYNQGTPNTYRLYTYMTTFQWSNFVNKRDIDACSIPINRILSNTDYQNQSIGSVPIYTGTTGTQTYLSGVQNQCFIYNNLASEIKNFEIDFKFKIKSTNENSTTDRVCLVLLKYKNGTSRQFKERIELDSWSNASSLQNQVLSFNGLHGENLLVGESLCLALEWQHIAQSQQRFVNVEFISTNVDVLDSSSSSTNGVYNYKLTCDFMLSSLFQDITTFQNMEIPSELFDANSLTDNFEIEMFPEWNNPNTSIKNNLSHTERLGNTGWFNENFNGLDNDFVVENVKYFDLNGNPLYKLDYGIPCLVECEVSGIGNLSVDSEFGIGFSWIPIDEDDFKHKETPFHQNVLINTARKYIDGSFNLNENTGSTIYSGNTFGQPKIDITAFENVMFTSSGINKVKMKAVFVPNPEFTQFFENKGENDRNYILWMSVADHNLQINFSNRVSLLVDFNSMEKTLPSAVPLEGMTNKFLEHPQIETANGVVNYYGHFEDDVLSRVQFRINKNQSFIESINFGYLVDNDQIGLSYVLERITKNVSSVPQNSNGIQDIVIDDQRGFKLVSGNNKNWVKINRKTELDDGDLIGYECFFATKIRWEDWIQRSGVPSLFYDTSKKNNGLNNDWLNYLRQDLFNKINFFVEILSTENDSLVVYRNKFQVSFDGYDENTNIETDHKYFRNSDNVSIDIGTDPETGKPLGVILMNEPTRIEITYTKIIGTFDIDHLYCTTNIEIENGIGEMEFRQLSSVWNRENDNPLIPVFGETKLKVEQLSPNVIKTSCLVDPELLVDARRYKVTGRIGCWSDGTNNNPLGLYENRYSEVYE